MYDLQHQSNRAVCLGIEGQPGPDNGKGAVMFKRLFTAAAVFGTAALAPPEAEAQSACLARDDLVKQLSERWEEAPVGRGLQSAGQLLEIWASLKSGTYTVFVTRADGVSCIVASGQHWNSFTPAMVPEGVLG